MNENTIRNNGQDVSFPCEADGKSLRLQNKDGSEYSIQVRLGMHGTNAVRLTHDFRVMVSGYTLSESQSRDVIIARLEGLGLVFQEDNPRERVQPLRDEHGDLTRGWKDILEMAGYEVPRLPMTEGFETTPDGLVFKITNRQRHSGVPPVLAREVRREAGKLIAAANRWLHENLRSFKRVVKLTPFEAVELYMRAKSSQVSVVEIELGEEVETRSWDPPSFGSGGGWSTWTVYGRVTEGETTKETKKVVFNHGPAAVYSAAGDAINGGRVFYRLLYVVSPSGDLAERAKS